MSPRNKIKLLFPTLSLLSVLFLGHSSARVLSAEKRLGFTIPSSPWTMTFPAEDFVVKKEQIKPDGSAGYFYLVDEKHDLNVSFFIEPATKCKTSKACRDMVWNAGNPSWENPQNVVLSEVGEASVFEFMVRSFQGQPIQQKNMYAQFVVDGFWVDLHLSKVFYNSSDRKLFERLIKAIRFEPKKQS